MKEENKDKEIEINRLMSVNNFDEWNELKKNLNNKNNKAYAHPREVWWCSIGNNVGTEANGKNSNFERPILVVKVYSSDSMLVLPITSKNKNDKFHKGIEIRNVDGEIKKVYVKLTQLRVISAKRLSRKVDKIDIESFNFIKKSLLDYI